jgi:histidinol phosphatase-like PHP family hydrolase
MHINWADSFSTKVINQLDYVLMDADTIPQQDGSHLRIWRNDLFIGDMGEFLDVYMNHIVQILKNEPVTIFARPTYLPINFARHYDEIWTRKRMMTIIDLAKERNIALEIQENTRIPSEAFIKVAKKAGIKFTFGTNARNHNAGNFNYCIEMVQACGLTKEDMFFVEN